MHPKWCHIGMFLPNNFPKTTVYYYLSLFQSMNYFSNNFYFLEFYLIYKSNLLAADLMPNDCREHALKKLLFYSNIILYLHILILQNLKIWLCQSVICRTRTKVQCHLIHEDLFFKDALIWKRWEVFQMQTLQFKTRKHVLQFLC